MRFDVSWPGAKGEGPSILATGIALTTRHENYDRVLRHLEWMASDEGQHAWMASTLSFPASQFVRAPEPVLDLRVLAIDLNSIKTPPALLIEAEKLSRRLGYR